MIELGFESRVDESRNKEGKSNILGATKLGRDISQFTRSDRSKKGKLIISSEG